MSEVKQLLKNLKSNNYELVNAAFEIIYYRYAKLVYFCINNIINSPDDASKLTNDVFIKLFEKRQTIDSEKNIKYYLTVSARNIAIDYLRKNKVQIITDNDIFDTIHASNKDREYFEVKMILSTYLNEKEIEIVFDHLIYGYSFKNIAIYQKKSFNDC